jgi:hypothetical protein
MYFKVRRKIEISGYHGEDVALCSLVEIERRFREALMMEAVIISETSVNLYQTTRRNISKGKVVSVTSVSPRSKTESEIKLSVLITSVLDRGKFHVRTAFTSVASSTSGYEIGWDSRRIWKW